ncbi:MAG: DNA replication/repair protein RecF [Woeseiaceae bacterium]|nr:DNA replication/repair protein RecF [Woeseiaceae bacterium]
MPITEFRARDFRCLEDARLELDPHYNLIAGPNASGKTSLLEALAYLGRGRSFRGAQTPNLIRHGASEFVLFGRVQRSGKTTTIGVRNSRDGLEVKVDGEADGGAAALAEALPLQVIDPDVHNLVSGGPEERRRFLDGIAFHVEHDFLAAWRRFRRALKQRNAALKAGGRGLEAWNAEFIELGQIIDTARRAVLEVCLDSLEEQAQALLGAELRFEYRSGWSPDKSLADALSESLERDRQLGSTQVGPHRADIRLVYDQQQARRLVSRGQQKLLAASMIIAATEIVQTHLERPMLLLLDDPAAELDIDSLARLLSQVYALGCQVVATSLDPEALIFPADPAVFHVEQGRVSSA